MIVDGMKKCSKCKEWKPISSFIKDRYTKDGFRFRCNDCRKIEYDKKHPYVKHRSIREKEVGFKFCSKCKNEKPKNDFYRTKNTKDGLQVWCKDCCDDYKRKYKLLHFKTPNPNKNKFLNTRICCSCKVEKQMEEFPYKVKSKNIRGHMCNECVKVYNKNYNIKNSDEHILRSKEYRKANPIKVKESKNRCYIKNKEHYIQHHHEYYIQNKEKHRATQKEYLKTPRGKLAESRVKHNRRKRQNMLPATLNLRGWNYILNLQNNKCAGYNCGKEFTDDLPSTKDHIIPVALGGGFTKGNVQALCFNCNCSKGKKVDFMRAIYTLLEYNMEI